MRRWILGCAVALLFSVAASADVLAPAGEVGIIYNNLVVMVAVDASNMGRPTDDRVDFLFTFHREQKDVGELFNPQPMQKVLLNHANVEFYGDRLIVTAPKPGYSLELLVAGARAGAGAGGGHGVRVYPEHWKVERFDNGRSLGRLSDPTGKFGLRASLRDDGRKIRGKEFGKLDDEDEGGGDDDDADYPDWWWCFWYCDPFSGGGGGGGWVDQHNCGGGGPGSSACSISCGIQGIGSQTKSVTCAPGLYACCKCDYLIAIAYCVSQ